MRFNKDTGKWEDKGGPKGMGPAAFRRQEHELARECHRRWQQLEKLRLRRGLSEAEIDQYAFLAKLAFDYLEHAIRPTTVREEAEITGSKKGIESRLKGQEFATADLRDEIRSIYRADKKAEWHRRELKKHCSVELGLRTMQRYLQDIRAKN